MRLDALYIYYNDRLATLVAESMLTGDSLTLSERAVLKNQLYHMWVYGMTVRVARCQSMTSGK